MNRYTDDMKIWLFDLAHGNLSDTQILTGFLKHYVLFDCGISDVQRDMVFHTHYDLDSVAMSVCNLRKAIESAL